MASGSTNDAEGRSSRWSLVAAVLATGTAIPLLVTFYCLEVYLPTLNTPHTALEGVPHEPSAIPPNPGLSRRLTFVVIDGLSYDAARGLDELLPLRRLGVMRSLAVAYPTYTAPAIVSFVTGVDPRDSGTRRNGDLGGVPGLDSVIRAVGDARVPLRLFVRSFGEGVTILDPPPGSAIYKGRFAPSVEIARLGLGGRELPDLDGKGPTRAFDFFHWGEVDEVGHVHGASSPEYLAEARNAALFLRSYAQRLDLTQDTLVVVSDHGHLPEGGHGGDEPAVSHAFFLGMGGFFRRGVELGERPMHDVAATLALVGGVRVPSSNLGLPMLDALALSDVETSLLLAPAFDESTRFLCRLRPDPRCAEAAPLVARLQKHDPTAWEEAQALHASLVQARERDLDARRLRNGRTRLTAAVALLLALAAVLRSLFRRRAPSPSPRVTLPALLAPLVNAAVFVAVLWARDYRPTFSHMPPAPLFAPDATIAAALGAAAVAALAWFSRPGRAAPWVLLAATVGPYALLAAYVGSDPVTPPPNVAGVLVFLLGPAIPGAAAGAAAMAWIEARRAR